MRLVMRSRRLVVQGTLVGLLALGLATGVGGREAAASKTVAVDCAGIYAAAMYAGNQYLAAQRRGDTITADWWWSIYEWNEQRYVRAGCLNEAV